MKDHNFSEKLHILFSTVLMTSQAANHKSMTLYAQINHISGRTITVRPLLITFVVVCGLQLLMSSKQ